MVNFYPKYLETTTIFILDLSIYNFGQVYFSYQGMSCKKLANRVDPDQTAPKEQSDLDLHYLLRDFHQNF